MPKTKTVKTDTDKKPAKTKAVKKSATKKTTSAAEPAEITVLEPSIEKQKIIEQFQVSKGDTGSPEVQAALLTKRIEKLVAHLKSNPSDNHSRRGLLGIVSKRRRLLNYLEKKDESRYKDVLGKLDMVK